ncbi:hypothetical protein [Nocardioides bigeumensis]|uniref:ARB-07466-like C-terminal domain-containing protein n=1 Tax=Nocardioides bigeumensis TaxID=433657 RepID=A0ABN2Y0U0_9ACTN
MVRRSAGRVSAIVLIGVGAVVAVVAAGLALLTGAGPLPDPVGCTASVQGREVTLSTEQAENAALISAIAMKRGMPPRAVSIALATAYQESKILNIEHGHLDSIGLFQQRPSQGWGTRRQILDPVYSINKFYDALSEVDGYESMRITVAAQAVQRSAYPEAYADHEADARVLASALTGETTGGRFWCTTRGDVDEESDELDDAGLTNRAAIVREELGNVFGDLSLGGFEPGGVTSGHMESSAHYDGRAVDVFFRPVAEANRQRGWEVAQYLVAQADRLSIRTVIFDGKIWTSGSRSEQGWRDYDPPSSSGDPDVLAHRDHVHVDVFD